MRLASVRIASARTRTGCPLSQAPCTHGRIWMSDRSMGLGTGKMLAVLACEALHHQRAPGARALEHVHGMGGAVADAWTGDTMAEWLDHRIAQRGRPAAYRKDGGSDVPNAVAFLEEQGLASPCLAEIAHAVAGRRTRASHDHPACATFVAAWGRVSGTLPHTMLACVAPPTVRTTVRCMPVPRWCPWAERVRTLAPPGGAKSGSPCTTWRACLEQWPACTALLTRCRAEASGGLACQKMLKRQGLSPDTRAQGAPRMATMPSAAVRQACRASRDCALETAMPLGRDHSGVPISSEALASLCGVAKRHGVGETPAGQAHGASPAGLGRGAHAGGS
jgi:hypothetical protein